MSNTVSTKKSNAIFLAAVLIVGTIAAISPSSFITGVNAQGDPYYGLDSYNDRKPYGMDDSYGASDYGMDNDRKSYDNSYKSQYQSYKPDYKPVKDDKRDKSKDSKVDINKLKCINTNLNINGENAGNVSIGNKGAAADGGYVGGGYSSVDGSDGYGSGDGYYNDGYNKNKKDNGFDCIINNNNTNINTVGSGNQTEPLTCEECFSILSERVIDSLLMNIDAILTSLNVPHEELLTIGDLCEFLETSTYQDKRALLNTALNSESVPAADINSILSCLEELGIL